MVQNDWLRPGTIIYVRFLGVFRHKGIVSNRWHNGKPMVIANSASSCGVAEIPWDDFTDGMPCYREGYPSKLHPLQVLYNARQMIGQPYNVAKFNCEHLVYGAHGQSRSPQYALAVWVTMGVGITAVAAAQS